MYSLDCLIDALIIVYSAFSNTLFNIQMIVCCPICRRELGDGSGSDNDSLHDHLDTEHGYRKCDLCQVSVYIAPDSFQQHMDR